MHGRKWSYIEGGLLLVVMLLAAAKEMKCCQKPNRRLAEHRCCGEIDNLALESRRLKGLSRIALGGGDGVYLMAHLLIAAKYHHPRCAAASRYRRRAYQLIIKRNQNVAL